jgi:DNA (cytosine-5)-methyltransferase 1
MPNSNILTVGSLFAGIGGFDLGLERTGGFRTSWFCEKDPYCQRVLAKHWPGIPCYPDITKLSGADIKPVSVLCGGFPCQDLSPMGTGSGLDGARSGLWSEYLRLIGEVQPRYVIVENVPELRSRGLGRMLGEMATLGYDAEWDCLPASAFGAPHRRDRIWIIAYPQREQLREQSGRCSGPHGTGPSLVADDGAARPVADPAGVRWLEEHPDVGGCEERARARTRGGSAIGGSALADADGEPALRSPVAWAERHPWPTEPDVGRVAHGVPARVDRLRALGNALVPQIPEWIGYKILEYEEAAVCERA